MIDRKATIKQQAKSRINWFGTSLLILAFLQANFTQIESYLKDYSGLVYTLIGIAIIILRQVTTKPVSEK